MHSTREICLKSWSPIGVSTFGISAINEALLPFGRTLWLWKSSITFLKSNCKRFQKDLMNLMLKPIGPGFLSPSQSYIASFISSISNLSVRNSLSAWDYRFHGTPSKWGASSRSFSYFFSKKSLTKSFTTEGSLIQDPATLRPSRAFFLLFQLIKEWKYFKLESTSLIYLALAFWLRRNSFSLATFQKSASIAFLTLASLSFKPCSSAFLSKLSS